MGWGSLPTIKKSTIQNVDYFEIRGGGSDFSILTKFKWLEYRLDFDDIWVRHWWDLVNIYYMHDWCMMEIVPMICFRSRFYLKSIYISNFSQFWRRGRGDHENLKFPQIQIIPHYLWGWDSRKMWTFYFLWHFILAAPPKKSTNIKQKQETFTHKNINLMI